MTVLSNPTIKAAGSEENICLGLASTLRTLVSVRMEAFKAHKEYKLSQERKEEHRKEAFFWRGRVRFACM